MKRQACFTVFVSGRFLQKTYFLVQATRFLLSIMESYEQVWQGYLALNKAHTKLHS